MEAHVNQNIIPVDGNRRAKKKKASTSTEVKLQRRSSIRKKLLLPTVAVRNLKPT
jgi:hypothetical protein